MIAILCNKYNVSFVEKKSVSHVGQVFEYGSISLSPAKKLIKTTIKQTMTQIINKRFLIQHFLDLLRMRAGMRN